MSQEQAPSDDLATQSDESVGYSSVPHAVAFQIIQIKRAKPDIEGQEIARIVGVHPSTVSRWLKLLSTDTVREARQLAKSQALRATMKLEDQVDHSDPRVSQGAAKALVALAGVQETGPQVQVGVQVIVGSSSAPAGPDPFAVVVESTPVSD
jgi:transposase-like protein